MKMIYCLIIIFFSGHSISAKEIELSLWEARNFPNPEMLDSVKVSFEAKGHKLEFRQAFQKIKGVRYSKQISLDQKDGDLEHFKSAMRIMVNASARALPDGKVNSDKIALSQTGLSSRIIFDQYVSSADSWHSMCKIFSWAYLSGKAREIKVIAYTTS